MGADYPAALSPTGSQLSQNVGPVIASATTIAPTYGIHHVSGTTAIVNITAPFAGFTGTIVLIPDAIWTWTAAGNIAKAGTVTAALFTVAFTFDGLLWYPSRVA